MAFIRHVCGHFFMLAALLFGVIGVFLMKIGAWLSDNEDELKKLDRKYKEIHDAMD